jgi:16S rRNA (uracil1498-N3)-methyltransferase
MTPPLFLVPDLGTGDSLVLTGPEAHHAATVKRVAIGELVLLADGRGGLAQAQVTSTAKDRVVLAVLERIFTPAPDPRFVVVQALPKGDRAEIAIEAMTELGVDEIVPWSASRSVSVWKGEKVMRGVAKWQRTATEAAKQSRRARVPMITELASTADVARRIEAAGAAMLLHEEAEQPLAAIAVPKGELVLVVGPEGGLAPAELAVFSAAGAHAVRLGPEVLRTSTAGAAALAVLSVAVGRWR